jgi:signal transduction histidine kinase/putative methionine-R-sulfoxide reductase with GAF domain
VSLKASASRQSVARPRAADAARPPTTEAEGTRSRTTEAEATRRRTTESARIAELEAALMRETRFGRALREVGLALGRTTDLDRLLELILDRITDALEADRATLYLRNQTTGELYSQIVQGDAVRTICLKAGEGIAGHIAETGKPLRVNDAYNDPRFNPEWDLVTGYRTRSILGAPMKNHEGRTIGVVQVLNKRSGTFTDVDAVILDALARQAAVSIDNSMLFISVRQKNQELLDIQETLEHRVRDLKLLFELERSMGRASSLDETLLAVLGEAMRSCEAKGGGVALRDPSSGDLFLHVVGEPPPSRKKQLVGVRRVPLAEGCGVVGHAMSRREPLRVRTADGGPLRPEEVDGLFRFECDAALAVPLDGDDGEALGALALYGKRGRDGFTEEDRELCVLIAANASTALRLQLARDVREQEARLTTIGRLLSGVVHDLKTPLTVIGGYARLMKETESAAERGEYAEKIVHELDQIQTMQREVLEFARGQKTILVRKVYLQKFWSDVKEQLEKTFSLRGIELEIDLQDRGTARFDEGKMLRLVHNLARNAVEAMSETKRGRFVITVKRAKDDSLVVTFADNGPGIPFEIEHRLFQSFATSGKVGGTGLGLAIVKKIAEEHGGTIEAQSSRAGATFVLTLPQHPQKSGTT